MSPEAIKALATEAGVSVTIGLVNRVHEYAVDDVALVKSGIKLSV